MEMKNIPALLNTLLNKTKSLVMEELNPDLTSGQSLPESGQSEPIQDVQSNDDLQSLPEKKITLIKGFSAVFNGLGIGLLLGLLLGLSISPVVSGVIATLSSLLAIFLGLNEKYLDPLKSLRIGAFGVFAVAGILLGLYMRANDVFAPTLLEKKNEYVAIGYTEAEARAFITKAVEADTGKTRREASVLYSSTVDASACDVLNYASISQPASELLNTFREAGGTWKELADHFQAELPGELVGQSLISIRDCFCSLATDGKIQMTNLDRVRKLNSSDSLEQLERVLSSSGESWKAIVDKISGSISENQRKNVYLSIIKVLSHD
jgi:hypothetical protein